MVCLFIKRLLTLCLSCLKLHEGLDEAVEGAHWLAWILQVGLGLEWEDFGSALGCRAGRDCMQQLRLQVAQVLLGEGGGAWILWESCPRDVRVSSRDSCCHRTECPASVCPSSLLKFPRKYMLYWSHPSRSGLSAAWK